MEILKQIYLSQLIHVGLISVLNEKSGKKLAMWNLREIPKKKWWKYVGYEVVSQHLYRK